MLGCAFHSFFNQQLQEVIPDGKFRDDKMVISSNLITMTANRVPSKPSKRTRSGNSKPPSKIDVHHVYIYLHLYKVYTDGGAVITQNHG